MFARLRREVCIYMVGWRTYVCSMYMLVRGKKWRIEKVIYHFSRIELYLSPFGIRDKIVFVFAAAFRTFYIGAAGW